MLLNYHVQCGELIQTKKNYPKTTLVNRTEFFSRRFPFDWRNPVGFMIAMTTQYVMFLYGIKVPACVLALSIGSYLYSIALSKDVKGSLFMFKRNIQSKADQSLLLEQLAEFIDLHSNAK